MSRKLRTKASGSWSATSALMMLLGLPFAGCQSPAGHRLDPLPPRQAAQIVNDNVARIGGTLRAVGPVDGRFMTVKGRQQSYHADGTLFFRSPNYLRFDVKKFNDRQILFGSNARDYWFYSKEDERYQCGRHGAGAVPEELPMPPDQVIDGLGLTTIPIGAVPADGSPRAQRVAGDHQVIVVPAQGGGRFALEKEYWLDRYTPRLVRRIIFRDTAGRVVMESQLDDYRALTAGGPMLPGTVLAKWPQSKAQLRFRANRWSLIPEVSPDSVQFATPRECAGG